MPEALASANPRDQSSIPHAQGAPDEKAGVQVRERKNAIRLQLIARSGRSGQLAIDVAGFLGRTSPLGPLEGAIGNGLGVFATGPLEYWVLDDDGLATESVAALRRGVAESASIFDQSDSCCTFVLSGPQVLDVLAKGTPIDLRSPPLTGLAATHSVIDRIPTLIVRRPEIFAYELLVPRSYAWSFIAWLEEATMECRCSFVSAEDGE